MLILAQNDPYCWLSLLLLLVATVSSNNEIDSVNGKVNNGDRVDIYNEVASLRSLLEGLLGAIAQEGLPGRKRPEDVLSIQDALYKAVERD